MNKYIFEATEQFLINKYGEPKEEVLPNGYTHRTINSPLNDYVQIINTLGEIFDIQQLDLDRYPQYENVVSEFVENCNMQSIERLKIIVTRFKERNLEKTTTAKNQLIKLANKLNEIINDKKCFEFNVLNDFGRTLKCGKGYEKGQNLRDDRVTNYLHIAKYSR